MLLEKYIPNIINEYYFYNLSIKKLKKWLIKSNSLLVLQGNVGSGKTILIHKLLHNKKFVFLNINELTTQFIKILTQTIEYKNVLDMMFSVVIQQKIIVLDDFDSYNKICDKNKLSKIRKIIIQNLNYPIILIIHNKKSINFLSKKKYTFINLPKLNVLNLHEFMNIVNKQEKLFLSNSQCNKIIHKSNGDLRQLSFLLYQLSITKNKHDCKNNIKNLKSIQKYVFNDNIFLLLKDILSVKLKFFKIYSYFETSKLNLPLLIYENYIYSVFNKNKQVHKLLLYKCSKNISNYEYTQSILFKNNNWSCDYLSCFWSCYQLNNDLCKYKSLTQKMNLNCSTVLNFFSIQCIRKKCIAQSNFMNMNFIFYSIEYLQHLYTIDEIHQIILFLKNYNIKHNNIHIILNNRKISDQKINVQKIKKILLKLQS